MNTKQRHADFQTICDHLCLTTHLSRVFLLLLVIPYAHVQKFCPTFGNRYGATNIPYIRVNKHMRLSLWVERKYALNRKYVLIMCGHTHFLHGSAHLFYTWTCDNILIGKMELASTNTHGASGRQRCHPREQQQRIDLQCCQALYPNRASHHQRKSKFA